MKRIGKLQNTNALLIPKLLLVGRMNIEEIMNISLQVCEF